MFVRLFYFFNQVFIEKILMINKQINSLIKTMKYSYYNQRNQILEYNEIMNNFKYIENFEMTKKLFFMTCFI